MSQQVSGIKRYWLAPMGVPLGDPITAPAEWTVLGRAYADGDPDIAPNGQTDSFGAPLYSSTTANFAKEFPNLSPYVAIKAWDDANTLVVLAMLKADGTFEYMKNVMVAVRIIPHTDKSMHQTLMLTLTGSEEDPDELWFTTFA